ncbi:ABC transporter permease [Maribacter sp. MMG018]|uniref:ABC transporter permease n=1 Tax=Maribacter sp. MMG018 TaxID=2822688 RepID=UPI001B38E0C4|nr:ABC transporter permease [Maribacter sp. MMG018]MBQ4913020.1 ABC transporter permease [Maribacter sp. MMG018]
MFKNHIKVAWRNLWANPLFSIINVLGLSLGMAIALVLYLFIGHELSFDNLYKGESNVYRILLNTDGDSFSQETWAGAPNALAPAMKTDIPNIKYTARILKHGFGTNANVKVGNNIFLEKELYWADADIFDLLKVEIVLGNRSDINAPNSVALSQKTAKQYFGNTEAIGKTIEIDNRQKMEVVAIYKDMPKNSSYKFNVIASPKATYAKNLYWSNASYETLVQFNTNISVPEVERQIQQLVDKNVEKENQWFSFSLQPLERIHLYSAEYSDSYAARLGDIQEIKNLSLLAILILVIACINYMNLTTARSQKRSKEVGINKTLGAVKRTLVVRFYIETALITLIAMIIGVVLAVLALPWFNYLSNQELDPSLLLEPMSFLAFLVIWAVTTLVAGSYPALYLSGFSPKSAFSPSYKQGGTAILVRKGLVVVQFAASAILIVGILIIYQQIRFIGNQNLGFEPDNIVVVSVAGINSQTGLDEIAQEFKGLGQVTDVALAQGFPGTGVSLNTLFKDREDRKGLDIQTNVSDPEVLDVLGLRLLAGTTLPKNKQENDTLIEVVLNKTAVDYLGYTPEEAINKKVFINREVRIVGVVDDFNFTSLHTPIGAYAFTNNDTEYKGYALVRFGNYSPDFLNQLERTFKAVDPETVFDYSFLDKNIEKLYEREQRTIRVGLIFCGLAILVACLGLFGLAAFMAEQRKKEIGIRKVLGASIFNVFKMLSTDFVKLVVLALAIAFPIAYWLSNRWLQEFAYHIEIYWWVFALTGLVALAITLFTISFQAIKAARSNPVKSLRTE